MRIKKLTHKSQSVIEYIAVIMVIVAVFIAMAAYYRRGLQARLRQAGDVVGAGEQYSTPASP